MIVGIDLGTTNTCVAAFVDGCVQVLPIDGARTLPSVVAISPDGVATVGTAARRAAAIAPERTFLSTKRLIGRAFSECAEDCARSSARAIAHEGGGCAFALPERIVTPTDVAAAILAHVRDSVRAQLGAEIADAVITVPAYFDGRARRATRDAARIAGWNVRRLLGEPTAAALAYGLVPEGEDRTVAVFDLGGGTFDISILTLGDGVYEVKAVGGDVHLGGDDIDAALADWLLARAEPTLRALVEHDASARARLREAAEATKIALSTASATRVSIPFLGTSADGTPLHLDLSLSRADFERIAAPTLARMEAPCREALERSGVHAKRLDAVLLAGGSTRMPAVRALARRLFGREPDTSIHPDEAVAIGAATLAAAISGALPDVALFDANPLTLGIETTGGGMAPVLERNATIPTSRTETFSTARDNQSAVKIHVVQGERPLARECVSLGRFTLEGIAPAPRGTPEIDVTFRLDESGVLDVTARDARSGVEQRVRIEGAGDLSDADIAERVRRAAHARPQDEEEAAAIALRAEVPLMLEAVRRALAHAAPDAPQTQRVREVAAAIERAAQGDDARALAAAAAELERAFEALAPLLAPEGDHPAE